MKRTILFDGRYDEANLSTKSLLTANVSLGRFIGSSALASLTESEQKSLARQLYLHAEMIELISGVPYFSDYSLQIMEAYPAETIETVARYNFTVPPIDTSKREGKTVVYALIDSWGHTNVAATFELASFLKDHILYDDIILEYDSYDPRGILNVQLIVTFPEFDETYEGDFQFRVGTWFNGTVFAGNDLLELQM